MPCGERLTPARSGLAAGLGIGLGCLTLHPDAFQQRRSRLVIGVLGDELAGERLLEDALPQPLGSCKVDLDRGLGLLNDREPSLYLGDDAALLGQRWEGNWHPVYQR